MTIRNLLGQWPAARQLTSGGDGTGAEAMSTPIAAAEPIRAQRCGGFDEHARMMNRHDRIQMREVFPHA